MTAIRSQRPIASGVTSPARAASVTTPAFAPLALSTEAKRALDQLAAVRRALPDVWTPYSPDSLFPRYKTEAGDIDHDRLQRALRGFARDVERASRDSQDPTLRAIHARASDLQDPSLINLIAPSVRSRQIYGGLKDLRVAVPEIHGADRALTAAVTGTHSRIAQLTTLGGALTAETATQRVEAEKARIDAQNGFVRFITGGRGKQQRLDQALAALKSLDVPARQKDLQDLLWQVEPVRKAAEAAKTITELDTSVGALKGLAQKAIALNGQLDRQIAALTTLKSLGV
jgi:hypothetical protein